MVNQQLNKVTKGEFRIYEQGPQVEVAKLAKFSRFWNFMFSYTSYDFEYEVLFSVFNEQIEKALLTPPIS